MTRALPPNVVAAAERAKSGFRHLVDVPKTKRRRGVMNKTEERYTQLLEAEKRLGNIRDYQFEAVKLRLANGAWYTPDFLVIDRDGRAVLHEVKGTFFREAARVRIKVAADRFKNAFAFLVARYQRGEFIWEQIQ